MRVEKGIDRLPSGKFRVRVTSRGGTASQITETLEDARSVRDAIKRAIVDGDMVPARGASMADLGPRYLATRKRERDHGNVSSRWDTHVAPAPWARKPLTAVTRRDGEAWLEGLAATTTAHAWPGERPVKPLSHQTRRHVLGLARAGLAWAVRSEHIASNPFRDLRIPREDGDEEEGFQDGWYLTTDERDRFLGTWERLHEPHDRAERHLVAFALGTGLRLGELCCLHLADLHIGDDEDPHVVVRFGSYDREAERFRSPKGRRGEQNTRRVPLWGLALDAVRVWLDGLPAYASRNPHELVFPSERGAVRQRWPRSWPEVVKAFGVLPRLGRRVWWHLLRHTAASTMVSGWDGMRWSIEDVQRVLGHRDLRTTQRYARLAPDAIQASAAKAEEAFRLSRACHALAPVATIPGKKRHARCDSNTRHSASKAAENGELTGVFGHRDNALTAVTKALEAARDRSPEALRKCVAALVVVKALLEEDGVALPARAASRHETS